MQELVLAAFVGLSLGNSWLCLFMAFGMSTADLRTGVMFMAGRTVGLVLLGLLIVFAGMFLDISPRLMQGVAGVLAVAFGLILIGQIMYRKKKEERIGSRGFHVGTIKTRNEKRETLISDDVINVKRETYDGILVMNNGGGCDVYGKGKGHHCENRENKNEVGKWEEEGTGCAEHRTPSTVKITGKHIVEGDVCSIKDEVGVIDKSSGNKKAFGFGLGVFRGITPCFKVVVLAPLIVAVPPGNAILMVLVFAAVSIVYPLIGYFSAQTLHNLVRNRRNLMIAGAVVLIIMGFYYIYESIATYGAHIPGSGGV